MRKCGAEMGKKTVVRGEKTRKRVARNANNGFLQDDDVPNFPFPDFVNDTTLFAIAWCPGETPNVRREYHLYREMVMRSRRMMAKWRRMRNDPRRTLIPPNKIKNY